MKKYMIRNYSIVLILLLVPLLLYYIIPILPTHDDWVSAVSPDFNPFFIKERFLFYGYHWRPFDAFVGYIVGRNPQTLFPTFNHYCVVFGHTICSLLVFRLLFVLGFDRFSRNIATLFFFITPATMATVLAIDSMNQTYALIWGIISFLAYIKLDKTKYIVWPILIFLATLHKENGLMWALICPILAYGFDFINLRTLKKDIIIGIGIMALYALAIILLPKDITIHPEYVPDVLKVISNFVKFVFSSFVIVDYVYLLHQPSRNLLMAGITFLLAAPFLYYIIIRIIQRFTEKKIICILLCLLIAVAPHIATVFSMMHTYAGLVFVTVMIAYSLNAYTHKKRIVLSFFLFLISAVMIDLHLWHESLLSGFVGKEMAQEAIRKTGKPTKNVYLIIIEDDYPKMSSFCVIPNEAFGWGIAAIYETNYQWPEMIKDTTIERSSSAIIKARELANRQLKDHLFDCIWIVDHKNIDVIKRYN